MKIYCEHCHEDISLECNKEIENYHVGRVICPKCHHEQKRYISEADLLLYFSLSEVFYIILSFATIFVFNHLGIHIYTILILFALFVASYIISKEFSSRIYENAYFKAEWKNKVFEEDQQAIQRNLSWQFLMFFAIAITFVTLDEGKIFFGLAMPIATLLSFIKLYYQLKYEKTHH